MCCGGICTLAEIIIVALLLKLVSEAVVEG